MPQTKTLSLIEAVVNTAIGFIITMVVSPFVNWICDIKMSIGQASLSTLIFTIISILRGYLIRRFFDGNIAHKIINYRKIKKWRNDPSKPWNYYSNRQTGRNNITEL